MKHLDENKTVRLWTFILGQECHRSSLLSYYTWPMELLERPGIQRWGE